MATNFPVALDTYVALIDNVDDVLAAHPNDRGDAVEQLEIKMGVDSSAVATSIDYFLKNVGGAYRTHKHDGSADDGAATIGPLTGLSLANNVDLGNYQLRGKQFYADVASGTPPLVISSDTHVVNLNVDRVDNYHLPATTAEILTDHDKANHDALGIDAASLDGQNASYYKQEFGSWASRNNNTVYQAAEDGFVVVTIVNPGGSNEGYSTGYTDGSNPPTTVRGYAAASYGYILHGSFCMPVKKSDYYKVVLTNTAGAMTQAIGWLPAS